MDVTGILKLKQPEVQVSEKFRKREFVLTLDPKGNYPQAVMFQLTQDKCREIDNFNEGEELKVSFNLRGREWKSKEGEIKYFNTLEAWRIERVGAAGSSPQGGYQQQSGAADPLSPAFPSSSSSDEGDLPF